MNLCKCCLPKALDIWWSFVLGPPSKLLKLKEPTSFQTCGASFDANDGSERQVLHLVLCLCDLGLCILAGNVHHALEDSMQEG